MKKSRGFTLLELIIVLGLISTMLLLGATVYSQSQKRSRDAKRKGDLNNIRSALELYRSNNSFYPLNLTDLTIGTVYLKSIPLDPYDPRQSYKYIPKSGCDNTTVLCNDYTLGTILENTPNPVCSVTITCPTNACNFCLNPYGEK